MSWEASERVWRLEIPRNLKLVLLAFADHAHPDGSNAFPSAVRVAWMTLYSTRQVSTLTKKLEELGLLVRSHSRTGKGNTVIYQIAMEHPLLRPPRRSTAKPPARDSNSFTQKPEEKGTTSAAESAVLRDRKCEASALKYAPVTADELRNQKHLTTPRTPFWRQEAALPVDSSLWGQVLVHLKGTINVRPYEKFFRDSFQLRVQGNVLFISFPDQESALGLQNFEGPIRKFLVNMGLREIILRPEIVSK
jgi:hypothetical protein